MGPGWLLLRSVSLVPSADGGVAFACIRTLETTYMYHTLSHKCIEKKNNSGQKRCIRLLCELKKRIKCVGNVTHTQCWSKKDVWNCKNECQWLQCSRECQ